jgi:hypothetical protein
MAPDGDYAIRASRREARIAQTALMTMAVGTTPASVQDDPVQQSLPPSMRSQRPLRRGRARNYPHRDGGAPNGILPPSVTLAATVGVVPQVHLARGLAPVGALDSDGQFERQKVPQSK